MTPPGLSQRSLLLFFAPLALGGIFFPLARPFLNATIARTADPITSLAAFSVALSLVMPFMSPLFALRQVATALAGNRANLRGIRNLSWILAGMSSGLLFGLCIPPVYRLVVHSILGIPEVIADTGLPVLVVFAATPLLAVGRGYYQGILVNRGRPWPVGFGALIYLIVIVGVMLPAVVFTTLEGALLAAIALAVGQIAYLLVVWRAGRRWIVQAAVESGEVVPSVYRFYRPLAVSTLLLAGLEPALQAGIVRVQLPEVSLAAYPICVSLIWLAGTPLWNVQQVVIARVHDAVSFGAVRKFILTISVVLSALMFAFALPPLSDTIFVHLMGVRGPVLKLASSGFIWFSLMPILMGARSLYQGTLIRMKRPGDIQSATIARIVATASILLALVAYGELTGLYLAIWAGLLSSAVEIAWLAMYVRRLNLDTAPSLNAAR